MKNFRGQRRYYRNLDKINPHAFTSLDFSEGPNSWFDLWHTHFDWKGLGKNSWKKRKPHLDNLFRHFDLLAKTVAQFKKPFHVFVIIYEQDSAEDAIYMHTPNPNQDNFPLSLKATTVPTFSDSRLQEYLNLLADFEKLYGNTGEDKFCILYQKTIGQAFLLESGN